MRKEYRQRLAKEYRYAAAKITEVQQLPQKLFYFSILFGEAQRILNFEWDRDLALVHTVTVRAHEQINGALSPAAAAVPVDWATVKEVLAKTTSDLAMFFESSIDKIDHGELCQILGRIAEVSYMVSGNGSYLYEKGVIKIRDSNVS